MKISEMQPIPHGYQPEPRNRLLWKSSRKYEYHQLNMSGRLIRVWATLKELHGTPAACGVRKLSKTNIEHCCADRRDSHGGYKWEKVKLIKDSAKPKSFIGGDNE